MKQVFLTPKGNKLKDVPAPQLQAGHLIVEVDYSMIGSLSEIAAVERIGEKKEQEIDVAAPRDRLSSNLKRGVFALIKNEDELRKLNNNAALGYGCSGRVVEIGEDVTGFRIGDKVACAGTEYAGHSELIIIPASLAARLPENCDPVAASSVSAGTVAINALRRSEIQLGETAAVIGLGLIGLIHISILKSSGVRVIAIDDSHRQLEIARSIGVEETSTLADAERVVDRVTGGMGVDICFITAPAQGETATKLAALATRKRGKTVMIGLVGAKIGSENFVDKEIDLIIANSFGAGRNDKSFEKQGLDYPYSYVRWTEKRNIEEYLRLISEGKIDIKKICEKIFPLDKAEEAFALLGQKDAPVGAFLAYSARSIEHKIDRRLLLGESKGKEGKIGLAIVGPGQIATKAHLPSIAKIKKAELVAVVGRNGAKTRQIAEEYKAKIAATSFDEILKEESIDGIIISTRHNLHAGMAVKALKAGKHVLVEKPLALSMKEMKSIEFFYAKKDFEGDNPPILMTGFSRRFSKPMQKIYEICSKRIGPMVINYQINAGYISPDHWLRGLEGGGRNLGEACHVYDIFTFLTEARVLGVTVNTVSNASDTFDENENFSASFSFEDGSIANLVYTNLGNAEYPREIMTVFVDENVMVLNDYKSVECIGSLSFSEKYDREEKGYFEEMQIFVDAIEEKGATSPIPLWQQVQTTRMAIGVETRMHRPVLGLDDLLDAKTISTKGIKDEKAMARAKLQSMIAEGKTSGIKPDDDNNSSVPSGDFEEKA